ncbi:hypothetical protein COCON_G00126610 [Conger conger]|uniref:DDH domain-containing protein n=1 Tax=Conger conger TaxID=82655 RepID=A0A9Q1HX22_CONCO|nr:hypothetical protein COCON_G00126610 [Conger conger]
MAPRRSGTSPVVAAFAPGRHGYRQDPTSPPWRSAEDHSGFHVVLGNEACDVDSMVSALSFAYFLFKTSGSAGRTPVPVLNIPRADFPLRTDSVFLLRESGLAQQDLVFRDEVDLPRLHRAGRLALTLVDHNVLPSTDSDLEGAVVEVIDHHLQERVPSPSCPVTIETVGSCATLVAERIVQKAPEIVDGQVALLLYGYYGDGLNAIILFSSCYLLENTIENYQYVMDNLFRYIVGTLELMVSENYVIVYLCSMAPRTKLPSVKVTQAVLHHHRQEVTHLAILRQCYTTIDRR